MSPLTPNSDAAMKMQPVAAYFLLACLTLFSFSCSDSEVSDGLSLINFTHLDTLVRPVVLEDGRPVRYVHFRADYPDYRLARPEKDGDGTVEDAARAVLAYLRWHELGRDSTHFDHITGLVRFLLAMQHKDGSWHNSVFLNAEKKRVLRRGEAAFGYPAAKALWALGRSAAFLRGRYPDLADEVDAAFARVQPRLQAIQKSYPDYTIIDEMHFPTWLINKHSADASSELLLGLSAYCSATGKIAAWREVMDRLATGILAMQQSDQQRFAHGMFFSYLHYWHGWSNAQAHALVETSALLGRPELLAAAEKEVRYFYPWLLERGFADRMDWLRAKKYPSEIIYFPQRAEHIRPVVLASLAVYRETGEETFARLAGQAARWLRGKNLAHELMYDVKTGRAKSYIKARNTANPHSTAAATAESLLLLMEVVSSPVALRAYQSP